MPVLAILILGTAVAADGFAQADSLRLAALIPAPDALPKGCAPRPLDDSAPPFLTTNPMASSDPKVSSALSELAFRGDGPATGIDEALLGVYQGPDEFGIVAFVFADAGVARQAGDYARKNEEAQEVLVQDGVLALIWRDGPDGACFKALSAHVRRALDLE